MSVQIGSKMWTFKQVHGRQFIGRDGFLSVRHHDDEPSVTISDQLPIDEQLELAAEAAVDLYRQQVGSAVPVIGYVSGTFPPGSVEE